jgi:hypothetical protein
MVQTRRGVLVTLFLVAIALISAQPSAAASFDCSSKCTPSSDCSTTCRLYGMGPVPHPEDIWGTCGEYGTCDAPCVPNFRPVAEEPIGVFEYFPWDGGCLVYEVMEVTHSDLNECGDPDFTACFTRLIGGHEDGFCCAAHYNCYGAQSCAY